MSGQYGFFCRCRTRKYPVFLSVAGRTCFQFGQRFGQVNTERKATVTLNNGSSVAAVLVKLTLEDAATRRRILPAYFSDNYVSLLSGEQRAITVEFPSGKNAPAFGLCRWNLPAELVAVQ